MIPVGQTFVVKWGLDDVPGMLMETRFTDTPAKERWVFIVDMQWQHGPDCPHLDEHERTLVYMDPDEVRLLPCAPVGHWLRRARGRTVS